MNKTKSRIPATSSKVPNYVRVTVFEGENLPAMDPNGLSDPYVEVRIADGSRHGKELDKTKSVKESTQVMPETLSPRWDEVFEFSSTDKWQMPAVEDAVVIFKVWDKDRINDDFIGRAKMPCKDCKEPLDTWLPLSKHDDGKFDNSLGRLHVCVEAHFGLVTSGHVVEHGQAKTGWKDEINKYYQLGRRLGAGTFAEVREGMNKSTKEKHAIKIINKSKLSKEDLAMLHNECEVLKAVKHPNVCRLYEIFRSPIKLTLVLELIDGGELLDQISLRGSLTEQMAAKYCGKVASGLAYIHNLDIAHRDMKPENLLLTSGNNEDLIKIVDFGFAKLDTQAHDAFVTACGTPEYVAPEILRAAGHDSYSVQCDVWSFGIIIYIMLCGYPPFFHENQNELFAMIKERPFIFPIEEWEHISPHAKDLVTKMLIKNPSRRITAEQMIDHPWIRDHSSHSETTLRGVKRLQGWNGRRKFKRAVNAVIAANRMRHLTDFLMLKK